MKLTRRAWLALPVAGLMAVAAVASPAAAATQGGTRGCSVNYTVKLATITTGSTFVSVGPWSDSAANLPTNTARNWISDQRSGNWQVTATSIYSAVSSCG